MISVTGGWTLNEWFGLLVGAVWVVIGLLALLFSKE